MKICIFGASGWIGSHLVPFFSDKHEICYPPDSMRVDSLKKVEAWIDECTPDRIICVIGRTHGPENPTVDYLELPGRLRENIRDNLFAPVALSFLCDKRNIHLTYVGSGCIFSHDPTKHYTEEDIPDFFGSSYSTVKGFTDLLMHMHNKNTLNVRIRMPIVADVHPRNFITKIASYKKVCSMPNSMSVLDTLFPCLADMIEKRYTGTINLTNPGYITHNEILTMYKKHVDPDFEWETMTCEQQDQVLKAQRSNCVLATDLLQALCPQVPNIHDAVEECLKKMGASAKS